MLFGFLMALNVQVNIPDIETHVNILSSEKMEGRRTGSQGGANAATYIVSELERIGALPLSGQADFRIPFEFTSGIRDTGSKLVLNDWVAPSNSLRGFSFSEVGEVEGAVVFVGYGITVPESQDVGYDSYFGLDVQDKLVVALRYFPEDVSTDLRHVLARYSGLRYKAMNARDRGALGLLVVSGPRSQDAGRLSSLTMDGSSSNSGIIAASISGEAANEIFAFVPGRTLEEVQAELDTGNPHTTGFDIENLKVSMAVNLERELSESDNVVGVLPKNTVGDGDEQMVLLGAHYDHLGYGIEGSSLARKDEAGKVFMGADDNASGVAAVLSIAQELALQSRTRDVAFAFWSGEELGLLGSEAFVESKIVQLEDISVYMNFDMVGRMRSNKLILQAIGSSDVWPKLVEQTNVPIGFDIQMMEDPYLPTDVMSFNQVEIPSINFFTGSRSEYHRPADSPELINYDDLGRIVKFGTNLVVKVMGLKKSPAFIKVARKSEGVGSRDTVRAFTGTIPDYSNEVEGLLLSGVVEGGPADEVGLKRGDVIVEFGGKKITNIYDYTFALDVVKIDIPVTIKYVRDGEQKEISLTPRSRR